VPQLREALSFSESHQKPLTLFLLILFQLQQYNAQQQQQQQHIAISQSVSVEPIFKVRFLQVKPGSMCTAWTQAHNSTAKQGLSKYGRQYGRNQSIQRQHNSM
jgi:hypothetical protein